VGLLLYGAYVDWVYPGSGRRHGERLLRELARARLGTSEVFAELTRIPTRLLRPGSQVALVSPLLPGDAEDLGILTARGYQVMVLVPDPTTVPAPSLGGPEVEIARRILQLERQAIVVRLHAALGLARRRRPWLALGLFLAVGLAAGVAFAALPLSLPFWGLIGGAAALWLLLVLVARGIGRAYRSGGEARGNRSSPTPTR